MAVHDLDLGHLLAVDRVVQVYFRFGRHGHWSVVVTL